MVESVKERVLYEDNHLIIVNKRCGELVQGDRTGDATMLDSIKEFIRIRDSKPGNVFLGLVHRLDRPTSGVTIFAKTSKALSRMNALFKDSSVRKYYWALVHSPPPDIRGKLEHYLIKDSAKNKSTAHSAPGPGRKKASLSYALVKSTKRYFLLEIELHTGRHHQIRAQLAALGISIRGDLKYGAPRSNPGGGISLHARRVEFIHPVSNENIVVESDPVQVQDDELWQKL